MTLEHTTRQTFWLGTGWLRAASAAISLLMASAAPASAAWPEKTVTVVVPYAAGGNTDIMARLATEWFSAHLPTAARPLAGVAGG